jgi:hypothetical protein
MNKAQIIAALLVALSRHQSQRPLGLEREVSPGHLAVNDREALAGPGG